MSGHNVLSGPTKAEKEQLLEERRKKGERLSCQAKIEKPGELIIMTTEKKVEPEVSPEDKREEFRNEFAELPFEEKMARLVELEAIALGETVTYVQNSPYKIAEKIMDVMADFGLKAHTEQKKASRPEEHHTEGNGNGSAASEEEKPGKSPGRKKPKKDQA